MARSSDLLPENIFIFFQREENVQKCASASCIVEQAFQSVNRVKTKANFIETSSSSYPQLPIN